MGQDASILAGRLPFVARLEVFCYSDTGVGRDERENIALADFFADFFAAEDIHDWRIEKVDSTSHRIGCDPHDNYVPVEVDFRYEETGRNFSVDKLQQSLRRLFHETIIPRVECFFAKKKNKALSLSIFPVDKEIPSKDRKDLSHSKVLVPLGIPTRVRVEIAPPSVDLSLSTELVHAAGQIPGQMAVALDACNMIHATGQVLGQAATALDAPNMAGTTGQIPGQVTVASDARNMIENLTHQTRKGISLEEASKAIERKLESMTGMAELREEYGESWFLQTALATPEIRESWGRSLVWLECFHPLVNDLQACVKRIGETGITNQIVYETLVSLNVATMMFSKYREEMDKTISLINQQHGKDVGKSTKRITAIVVLITVGVVGVGGSIVAPPLMPAALAVLAKTTVVIGAAGGGIAATGGGIAVAISEPEKREKIKKKKANVDELDSIIDLLGSVIEDTRIAMAAMFCDQVLNIPVQRMPEHKRREILERLGVASKDFNSKIFREGLTQDRMERLLATLQDFENARATVRDDTGLKEYIEAAGDLPAQDGEG